MGSVVGRRSRGAVVARRRVIRVDYGVSLCLYDVLLTRLRGCVGV